MNYKRIKLNIIVLILIILVSLISIGYAALVDTLSLTNSVAKFRADVNTRVTGVVSSSSYVSNMDYNVSSIKSIVNIPSGSSVTYQVTLTTFGNVPTALSNIQVLSGGSVVNNVSVTPTLANTYIKICNNNDVCTLNVSKTVDVTITNNTGSAINTANFVLKFTYTPFYTVTYNSSIIGDVLSGGTFEYVFASNAPTSVEVTSGSCGTPSITGATLTVSSVTSNIVLTGSSTSSGDGTYANPYVRSASVYDSTDVLDGYNIFNNAPGAPKVNATVTTSGSTTVTTINSFELTDTGTNGLAFGTSGSGNNPVLDTNLLVLDGTKFSIHIKFKTNLTSNKAKFVLSALSQVSTTSYSGFSLNIINSSTPYLQVSSHINKGYSGDTLNATQSKSLNTSADATSNTENLYEITMVYTAGGGQPFVATCTGSNCTKGSQTLKKNSIPSSLSDAKVTIGGNGINNNNDMASLKVLELHICKGTFGTDYTCTLN